MSRLEQVLALARHVPVFPCRRTAATVQFRGKPVERKPKSPLTEHGFEEATQDETTIREWAARHPDCLWGVPTGTITGLVVIDYDTEKADEAGREWLAAHADTLTTTKVHSTLSGGRHYLFRSAEPYSSGVCVTLAGVKRTGIDIRAEGGYIIWWPLEGLAATEEQAAPLPAGLLDGRSINRQPLPPLPQASPSTWQRDARVVADVLAFHDPENYDEWIQAGMSVHSGSGGSDEGFRLWSAWSSGELTGASPRNYSGLDDLRYRWESFSVDRPRDRMRGIGSLITTAKARGYLNGSAADVSRGTPRHSPGLSPEVVNEPGAETLELTDTDIANGRRLAIQHGEQIRYTPQQEWLLWDGKRWAPDVRSVGVQGLAKKTALAIYAEIPYAADQKTAFRHAKASQSKRAIEAMLFMLRSEDGIPANIAYFDADPWLLNVNNGTVNLRTGELLPHSKTDHITKLVPVTYSPNFRCDLWLRFMAQVTNNSAELLEYLQRVVGYCLTGLTSEQVLHFLYGLGANGKSVFSELLADLLGEYAIIVSPEMVMTKRNSGIPNDIARLRGARLALMNETSQGSSFDEQKLKDLTGSDSLTGRFLRQEFFDFKPTHKLIIRGNHKPAIAGTDDGIWRRLRLVPFTVQFPAKEQDRDLLRKLRAELPGILNWAIAGCLRWQQEGLTAPESVTEASADYRVESDTLGAFIEELCTTRPNAQVKSSVFFQKYQEYAKSKGERWMPAKDLPQEMQRRGFKKTKTKAANVFEDIELNQASESYGYGNY